MRKRVKGFVVKVKRFVADESGLSGIVVAIGLIIMAALGMVVLYTSGLMPTLTSAGGIGGAMGQSGTTATTNWGNVK